MKNIFLLILFVYFSGCTIAPLTEPHTARVLGKGNSEWAFGVGHPGYLSIGYAKGVNDRLDIGGVLEFQGIGILTALQGKYLLTPNNPENPFSLFVGGGIGTSTTFGYIGPIKSFRISPRYELAFGLRYNVFKWDIDDEDDREDAGDFLDDVINGTIRALNQTYQYATLDMSNTFWFSPKIGLTLSVAALTFFDEEDSSDVGVKAGLKFHSNY